MREGQTVELEVDRHRVDDGERRLVLRGEAAGEDLEALQDAGDEALGGVRRERQHRRALQRQQSRDNNDITAVLCNDNRAVTTTTAPPCSATTTEP